MGMIWMGGEGVKRGAGRSRRSRKYDQGIACGKNLFSVKGR